MLRSTTVLIAFVAIAAAGLDLQAQRRSGGLATLAIFVSDATGNALGDVKVTVEGPASREARTERGRIVFEDVPTGTYRLRFDREGYVSLERELVARAGAPVDVKVTLTAAPPPPAPPEPKPAPPPPVAPIPTGAPVSIDLPSFIEKNYVGRAAGKNSSLACAASGDATLIQLHEPLAEHTHATADEFLYVIAGEGTAHEGKDQQQQLYAGVLLVVPRGMPHSVSVSGRNPLVILSIRSGDKCTASGG
jgi:mannose-6-phosphate isomerase-like protein (cupin superfamily)